MAYGTLERRATVGSWLLVSRSRTGWKNRDERAIKKRLVSVIAALLLLAMLLATTGLASANVMDPIPFVERVSIPIAEGSFAAWGDYDQDGDLDLAAGCSPLDLQVHIYRNHPTGVLAEVQAMPCGRSILGDSDPWADYDGDDDLDLALPGRGASFIYRNDGGTFVPDTRTSLPAQSSGGAWFEWGDLDNDNDPDLVLIGTNASRVFINDGTGLLTSVPHPFPTRDNHTGDLGDYDNDGFLDLVTVGSGGSTAGGRFALLVYHNDGNPGGGTPTFTRLGGELADRTGNVHWVDYNQDGLLDIFVAGSHDLTAFYYEIWAQSPSGIFVQTVPTALGAYAALRPVGTHNGFTDWGDYDGDGDPDLIISSNTLDAGCLTRTYRNEPAGNLVEDDTTRLYDLSKCFLYPGWGDFDNDLDMDLVTVDPLSASTFLRVFQPNTDPLLSANTDPLVVDEGDPALNTGTVSDDDGDVVVLSASVGTVVNNLDDTWSWSLATTDGPTQSQVVSISGDDGFGATSMTSFALTVSNVAPTVDAVFVPTAPLSINDQPVSASGTFSDPAGTGDEPYSCTVDYGEGSGAVAGTVAGSTCLGPSQSYTEAGVYTVTVEVTDKDGASGSAQATSFIVIYDPDGGFVTGGGWIDSPEGAYSADPALVGRANFGFVSKYKKRATIPTGQTEFHFQVADLNFHSDAYEWLVIAGPSAKYKGSGTINGSGNYRFMLTACDVAVDDNCQGGDGDTFRIKIWDSNAGDAVVYDNKMGASDGSNGGTVLGGGNIKVYKR